LKIKNPLTKDVLHIDCAQELEKIAVFIRETVFKKFKKRGIVVALSGGIDSSVVGALCIKALGKQRVLGLFLPEKDSAKQTMDVGRLIAKHLEINTITEDITPILEAEGCYFRRDEAIRSLFPEYGADYKSKIVLPPITSKRPYRLFSLVIESPSGEQKKKRLTYDAYMGIIAANTFKQRTRKTLEYYYADRYNYAVAGTANLIEYDQGFFVKNGDGSADIKPLAHLYKTQVYQMAQYLHLPSEIICQKPTTDTYSMFQTQEEFYFSISFDKLDLCLYAKNNNLSPDEIAPVIGISIEDIKRIYRDIESKRKAAYYLNTSPVLIEIPEENANNLRGIDNH